MRSCDQGVGVRRVTNDEDSNIIGRAGVDRLTLWLEDPAIGLEEVTAFHPLGARACANEQRNVCILEAIGRVVRDLDTGQQWERTVVEFHRHALGSLHALRDLKQAELHWHVGPEHLAGSDPEEQRVADLACGAGDSNGNGTLGHEVVTFLRGQAAHSKAQPGSRNKHREVI